MRLKTTFGLSLVTVALSSLSFSGTVPPSAQAPVWTTQTRSLPAQDAAARKKAAKHPPHGHPTPLPEQQQLPSPQALTRADLQNAARHEPPPDEGTLREQIKESQRMQEEQRRREHELQRPQVQKLSRPKGALNVAEDEPQNSVATPVGATR